MNNTPDIDNLRLEIQEVSDLEYIAEGSFKAVYKGKINEVFEAIKLIYLQPVSEENNEIEENKNISDQMIARVNRELLVLGECACPYLVNLGTMELRPLIINNHEYFIYSEEYLDGTSLRNKIDPNNLPEYETVKDLAVCLLSVIEALSEIEHIHRDIKPDNIINMPLQDRPFVILDLGIAFKIDGTFLTQNGGGAPGTPPYMAPELFSIDYHDKIDLRSDVFSTGVTIYEFASGQHPFADKSGDVHSTIRNILKIKPLTLHSCRPDLPEIFCKIIDRCISKKPALRFIDINKLIQTIREI